MTRTAAEVDELAKLLVNKVVADVLFEFAAVRAAVDKLPPRKWLDALDEQYAEVADVLKAKFGASA